MAHPMTITLAPVKQEDVPHLANIYILTNLLDNALKLNYPTPQHFIHASTLALEIQLDEPS